VHSLLEKHEGHRIHDIGLSREGHASQTHVDKDPHNNKDQVLHSRLLTKKQISDLTLGIRELSKKLAQLRLQLHVRNVFIIGKAHDKKLMEQERITTEWLLENYKDIKV
jgi:NAD+ kinase